MCSSRSVCASALLAQTVLCNRSLCRLLKKRAVGALFELLPYPLTAAVMLYSMNLAVFAWLAQCRPRSLWKMGTAATGWRRNEAVVRASFATAALVHGLMDQPMISRLSRFSASAGYRQPWPVRMQAMELLGPTRWVASSQADFTAPRYAEVHGNVFQRIDLHLPLCVLGA